MAHVSVSSSQRIPNILCDGLTNSFVCNRRGLLQELGHDAVVLSLSANFAWLTSGARSYVFMATEGGVGSICVDASRVAVLTNEIEGHRLVNEEMRGLESEITLVQDPWHAQRSAVDMAKELAKSDKVAVDAADPTLAARLAELRSTLTAYEMDVFRALGKDCGELIGEVARVVRPDMTEWGNRQPALGQDVGSRDHACGDARRGR